MDGIGLQGHFTDAFAVRFPHLSVLSPLSLPERIHLSPFSSVALRST